MRWQVAEDFQNGITNRKGGHIYVFQANVFLAVALILISEAARISHLLASRAILLKCNDPHINFILHQEPINSFFKRNKEFKCTKLGRPGVFTLFALKLEEGTFNPR